MEDRGIVELYLKRDSRAIEKTQEKYGGRLRELSFNIIFDAGAAEECENDTYLAAWNSIPPHEPASYLYAFLARIVRRLSLNVCRNKRRLKRGGYVVSLSQEMEDCIPSPDNAQCRLDEEELRKAINGFLATLGDEKRNIFLRRYWYLDSVASIADRYGIGESKVKMTLKRTRGKLREYLIKEGYEL